MSERLNIQDRARDSLVKAKSSARIIISSLLENPEVAANKQHQSEIAEKRIAALHNPGFPTLLTNLEYQKWIRGEYETSRWDDPTNLFEAVRSGTPYNKYMSDAWKEAVIDPSLEKEQLHVRCIDYCSGTAQAFVDRASEFAGEFTIGKQPSDVEHMTNAIAGLIGTSNKDINGTIFKDFLWSNSSYRPDYARLEVDPLELTVSEEKIMAGVGLCVGLWIRLADLGAQRPVSGHNFGPTFSHCSFSSLARDSGWTDYTNIDGLFHEAHAESYGNRENTKQNLFFDMFRDSEFFVDTHAALQSTD